MMPHQPANGISAYVAAGGVAFADFGSSYWHDAVSAYECRPLCLPLQHDLSAGSIAGGSYWRDPIWGFLASMQ
eukprot:2295222-Lingulodinium_polyedra.AAC.1